MRTGPIGVVVAAAAGATGCAGPGSASPDPARAVHSEETFDSRVSVHVRLRYLLALPDGYGDRARRGERWPLLLFLHGLGECGGDLRAVVRHGPPKLLEAGRRLPCIVVSPQCEQPGWSPLALNALVDELGRTLRVDESRVWLTGLSMGGFGAWAAASDRPDRYAALVPMCGGGDWIAARRLKDVPVWAFHGRRDPLVPLAKSEEMVLALKSAGGRARLTIYDDLGHDCWTRAYEDPELWNWLFAQRRAERAPE